MNDRRHRLSVRPVITLALLSVLAGCGGERTPSGKTTDTFDTWGSYLGDEGRRHYSSLTEIDSANLDRLEVAWTYYSGDAGETTRVQCNPLYGDGRVYVITAGLAMAALDAGTGEELWRFAPFTVDNAQTWAGQSRGMHLWRTPDDEARVVWAVADRLYLLDAATGLPIGNFGEEGAVDLRGDLLGNPDANQLAVTSPGVIFGNLVALGFMSTESQPAARGCIRAYDLTTGEMRWRFDVIPREGDPAAASWVPEELAVAAGANNWCGMALDVDRELIFVPTGSAVDDFYGGRRKGDNLYANCLLALDANTGALRWHQQLTHHDLWDTDLPSPPTLVEVRLEGKTIDAVAQPTKQGELYVFDRDTGEPLFDYTEVAVPPSGIPGEVAALTQPRSSLPPFVRQEITAADLHTSAAGFGEVAAQFASLNKGWYAPPSLRGTLMSPGYDGGASWGGAGTVPGSGLLVINANEAPSIVTLKEQTGIEHPGERAYVTSCAGCHGTDRAGGTFHGNIPSLRGIDERFTEVSLAGMIHDGRGAMPGFAHLGEIKLNQISRYLLDLPVAPDATSDEPADPTQAKYVHTGYKYFYDEEGFSVIAPPWGTLTAYDLNAGAIRWQRPLGVDSTWAARGEPETGTRNYGGPLLTATGLIFIGATTDAKLRAFSLATGAELWQSTLPFDGVASPASYRHNGKQYILIAAGGGKVSKRRGDAYVAYAVR